MKRGGSGDGRRGSGGGSGGGGASVLRALDAFPKIADDFAARTASGGVVTLTSLAVMALLFLGELGFYLKAHPVTELSVDTARDDKMTINFDLTFPRLPCSWLSLDAMDISGEVELDVDHDVYKRRLDPSGKPFTGETHRQPIGPKNKPTFSREEVAAHKEGCGSCYGASANASHCCNTCDDVREAYKAKAWSLPDPQGVKQCHDEDYYASLRDQAAEGCHLWGVLRVARVAGNFHVAVGKSYTLGGQHYHDLAPLAGIDLDLQHSIAALQFGQPVPGRHSPLDGTVVSHDAARSRGGKPGQVQYFLKVVPTSHTTGAGGRKTVWSSSYAVTEHVRTPTSTPADPPGVFFFYELSPLRVATTESRPPFLHFITSVCAVVGGVWSLSSLVDAAVYRGARATRRKVDLGKTG